VLSGTYEQLRFFLIKKCRVATLRFFLIKKMSRDRRLCRFFRLKIINNLTPLEILPSAATKRIKNLISFTKPNTRVYVSYVNNPRRSQSYDL
jgi:hypothetical protein